MTKKPINQPTLSDHVLLAANYAPPHVETIALATQDEIKHPQAADPTVIKIIKTFQNGNAAKHPIIFFTEDGILYCQVKDQCQLVIPLQWSTKCFTNSTAQRS
uniref:Uncharacterized protein n=1 Tax=Romanomermis culicivorax TaxID=13658 RepID=A0A915IS83_ROMCU